MSDLDTLYDRNEEFASTFDQGDLPILPRRPTIILTCVDSRVDPPHFLGLELGDTLVLRNSGGRVTDEVIEQIAILRGLAVVIGNGALEVAIVHHTDCGTSRFANPQVRTEVGASLGDQRGSDRKACHH